jgi:hypothetical protein
MATPEEKKILDEFYKYANDFLFKNEFYEKIDEFNILFKTEDYPGCYVLISRLINDNKLDYDENIVGDFFYRFVY